jgi:N6-L-threonylcarbamoyladenine synthase
LQISGGVGGAHEEQAVLRGVLGDQCKKIVSVAFGGDCLKAGSLCCGSGAVADTVGAVWQGEATGGNPPCGFSSGLGGQDQGAVGSLGNRGGKEFGLHQRGNQRAADFIRKALALQQWAGQQDRGLGLSEHALGVTCDGASNQRRTMTGTLTFLGIESSCDDTAAAVIRHAPGQVPQILASVVEGQVNLHAAFGGVVPEIAARAHAERLDHCVERALIEAGLGLGDLDGIAVTAGPGLIGGVLSGVMLAKGLATATGLPMVGVNHLAGHALTPRLTDQLEFPYLMLLVSGGHCQFLIAHGPEHFQRLGGTIDDAPGEAFDKTAKLLGLPQPGGPAVQAEAELGDTKRFTFPRPLLDRPGCDMSFSGLKTALLRARDAVITEKGGMTVQDRRDLCAGFQRAVAEVLAEKTRRALVIYSELNPVQPALAVAGGVAANTAIRALLETVCAQSGTRFLAPPLRLCTDNAAMIAWAGIERFRAGGLDNMGLTARPRWPLDATAAPMIGSGKKGAKA